VCAAVWDRQSRICSTENNTLLSWVAPARFLLEIAAEDRHPLLLLDRARPLVQLQTFRRMSPQLKPPQLSVVVELEPQRPRQPHPAEPAGPAGPGGGPGGPGFPPGPPPVPPKLLVFVLDGKAALPNVQQ